MKKTIIIFFIILSIITGLYLYVGIKKESVAKDVEEYLIEEKGLETGDIIDLEPFIANLSGDKNILVYVKLKNDDKKYYYYKDKSKKQIILHSYTLDGKEHVIN
jgi:hypothetical protein